MKIRGKNMKTLCNIIWFIFGGFISALLHFVLGILLCVTIIGFPLGRQFLKISKLVRWPFGKMVVIDYDAHPYLNIIFLLFGGFFAVFNVLLGIALCVTIIGIPFGKQCFKLARLRFAPFGSIVE